MMEIKIWWRFVSCFLTHPSTP